MKLVQVGTHGIATASGDGRVARLIMDQIDALTSDELGRGVKASLALAAERTGLSETEARSATWLCAEWWEGALSTSAGLMPLRACPSTHVKMWRRFSPATSRKTSRTGSATSAATLLPDFGLSEMAGPVSPRLPSCP